MGVGSDDLVQRPVPRSRRTSSGVAASAGVGAQAIFGRADPQVVRTPLVVLFFRAVTTPAAAEIKKLVDTILAASDDFRWWGNAVMSAFQLPSVADHVHSLRFRLKSPERIRQKIETKLAQGEQVTTDNVFEVVADFAGVRVLHLRVNDIAPIHKFICATEKWQVVQQPFAIVNDDRFRALYESLGIKIDERPGRYSSVHCAVGHKNLRCEVQVRTLWEEIWGEVSHPFYEHKPIPEIYSRNLEVLSRLCVLGSAIVEDLHHLVARERASEELLRTVTTDRDKLKAEADAAKSKVEELTAELDRLAKQTTAAPPPRDQLLVATGIAQSLSASLHSLSDLAGATISYAPAVSRYLEPGALGSASVHLTSGSLQQLLNDPQASVHLVNFADPNSLASGSTVRMGGGTHCGVCGRLAITMGRPCTRCGAPICVEHVAASSPASCGCGQQVT